MTSLKKDISILAKEDIIILAEQRFIWNFLGHTDRFSGIAKSSNYLFDF